MASLLSIGRAASELLDDDFKYGQSLRVKTKNDVGLEVLVEGELAPMGAGGSITAARKVASAFFHLDKLRVRTDGRVAGEASYALSQDSEVDSRLYVAFEDGRQEPGKPLESFGKAGSKLKTKAFDLDASIDVVNGPTCRAAALYRSMQLCVGVEAQVNTHWEEKQLSGGSELEDFNVGASYTTPQWSLSGRTSDRLSNIHLSYLHQVAPSLLLASQLHYGLGRTPVQRVSLGVQYGPDAATVVKGKVELPSAVVSAAYKRRLSDYVQLTVCAAVDAQDLGADSHRFGLGLSFE